MKLLFLKYSIFITIVCGAQKSTNAYNLDNNLNFSNQNTEKLVKKNRLKSSTSSSKKRKFLKKTMVLKGYY